MKIKNNKKTPEMKAFRFEFVEKKWTVDDGSMKQSTKI